MKTIQYAISAEGIIYSRVDSEVAVPVLDYEKIGEGGSFNKPLEYNLERFPVFALAGREYNSLRWTRKIPLEIKNLHRAFWSLPPLSPAPLQREGQLATGRPRRVGL